MTITTTAIYENGVLRPITPLALAEGVEVHVTVADFPLPSTPSNSQGIIELLAKMDAMPMEVNDKGFSGRDHDDVLYPKKPAP